MNSFNQRDKMVLVIVGLISALMIVYFMVIRPATENSEYENDIPIITKSQAEKAHEETDTEQPEEAITEESEEPETTTAEQTEADSEEPVDLVDKENNKVYKFRNNKLLDQHYKKHGKDMGFSSAEEYELAASDVINSPEALYKTEAEDGDGVYYIESTNEFVILSKDGYIRTYFYPSGGKAYFDRQ